MPLPSSSSPPFLFFRELRHLPGRGDLLHVALDLAEKLQGHDEVALGVSRANVHALDAVDQRGFHCVEGFLQDRLIQ
jgi:hypothetical protein